MYILNTEECKMGGCCGCTPKCKGGKLLVAGLLLLVAAEGYFGVSWNPWAVVSWLLVIKGLMMLLFKCPCQASCEAEMKMAPGKKKK